MGDQKLSSGLEAAYLYEISRLHPSINSALSRISMLKASLLAPKRAIHVISDVHGEYGKLRHIINNASGSLRQLVTKLLSTRLSEKEQVELLNFIHYPKESFELIESRFNTQKDRFQFIKNILSLKFELIRELAKSCFLEEVDAVVPEEFRAVLREVILLPLTGRSEDFINSIIEQFIEQKKEGDLLRMIARIVRNLLISEIVVAGDLGDRGPRIDKVIDYLTHQPNVRFTWGNHDATWLGACLGDLSCIANVLRISLRYRRLSQLEEGYGIPIAPLEKLVREVYFNDPAERFACKGEGLRDPLLMARMQKAIAIIQFKLEGQTIRRNPQFKMESRTLLHLIDPNNWIVAINGKSYVLLDKHFPTIDWSDPYKLNSQEEICLQRLQKSFLESTILWDHMRFMVNRGNMYLLRDKHLIFHACVPCDDKGDFLEFEINGTRYKGKSLFDAFEQVVQRSIREKSQTDLDLLWYLWGGPLSPWFGKDKMATFETYFIDDKEVQHEEKNSYFKLIHDKDFCSKVLNEFGVKGAGLIVNGHVPVKIEKGESPLKKSGLAVTIDGAFSEAYGDKGYTLLLEPDGTYLAQHYHFESVEESITKGADIVPEIKKLLDFSSLHVNLDTEKGEKIQAEINMLERLIAAYRSNQIREKL